MPRTGLDRRRYRGGRWLLTCALVVVATVLADLAAQHVGGVGLEVVAVADRPVVGVDLGERTAAGAEEQQIGDEQRAGEHVGRQAVRRGEVVPAQDFVAQGDRARSTSGEEAARDEEHAETVRRE